MERPSLKLSEMKFISGAIVNNNSFMKRMAKDIKLKAQRKLQQRLQRGEKGSPSPPKRRDSVGNARDSVGNALQIAMVNDPSKSVSIEQQIRKEIEEHDRSLKSAGSSVGLMRGFSRQSMESLVGRAVKDRASTGDSSESRKINPNQGLSLEADLTIDENDLGLRQRVKEKGDMHFYNLQRRREARELKEQIKLIMEENASRDIKNLPHYIVVASDENSFDDDESPVSRVQLDDFSQEDLFSLKKYQGGSVGSKSKYLSLVHKQPFEFDAGLLLKFVLSNISLEFLSEHELKTKDKYRDHRFRRYSNQFASYLSMIPSYSSHVSCFRAIHRLMLKPNMERLLQNVFWFVCLRLFQPHSSFQQLLVLDVISDIYFEVAQDLTADKRTQRQYKDMFYNFMPYLIAEACFQGEWGQFIIF